MLFRDPASLFPNFSLDNLSKFPTAQIQEFVHWARAPFGLPLDGSRFIALFVPHDLKNARRAVVNTRVLTNQLVQVQRKRSGGGQLSVVPLVLCVTKDTQGGMEPGVGDLYNTQVSPRTHQGLPCYCCYGYTSLYRANISGWKRAFHWYIV